MTNTLYDHLRINGASKHTLRYFVTLGKSTSNEKLSRKDKKEIGIEIQSPTNNAIRKVFEDLGYNPTKIDRVYYCGLTKKNLPRKESRFLTNEEITILKRQ